MQQLRTSAMTTGLPKRTNLLPALRECRAFGKWEGESAGRMTTMFGIARERSMPQLECDEERLAIVLADTASSVGRVLGNSYVVGHGSYPR
jgi:hypothetical protein